MKVVLNTSPIIFLGKIDCLKILTECFAEIYVPQGVIDELQDYPLPVNMQISTLSSEGAAYVRGALGRLHQGELEAIILAQELLTDYVILDDLLARRKTILLYISPSFRQGLPESRLQGRFQLTIPGTGYPHPVGYDEICV